MALPPLAAADKAALLRYARQVIRHALLGGAPPAAPAATSALAEPCGAFVTLTVEGALRGCIGNLVGDRPLVETIREMALAAAFHDPRFPALSAQELRLVRLEISVLSPMELVDDPRQVQVGHHGLVISRGPARGVLLPQVASHYGWDRVTFLGQTCRKAGLPPDAWMKKGTLIQAFTAEIFSEAEIDHDLCVKP
ncbi:MAG: AmmeMemoRadiSam system protein A [Thermodesulfobacteriota bacterium]